jgi:hypothetical protein
MTKKDLCKAVRALVSGYESETGQTVNSLTMSEDNTLFTLVTKAQGKYSSQVHDLE